MRLCKDCTHFRQIGWDGEECARPLSDKRDPVNGELYERLGASAWNERSFKWAGVFRPRQRCGPDAIYFEAKGDAL